MRRSPSSKDGPRWTMRCMPPRNPRRQSRDSPKQPGARGKVNPPLRSPADRDALWDAFRQGRIDAVASDHAPHTLDEKGEPFEEAPAGIPGVATAFPLLMRRIRAGNLDL